MNKFKFEEWRAICEVVSYFLLATSFVLDKLGTYSFAILGVEVFILSFCAVKMILSKLSD